MLMTSGRWLVVFPEGEIYHTNERLTPLREGVAFMALTAQRELDRAPGGAHVWVVPTAIRYRYLEDIRPALHAFLDAYAASVAPIVDVTGVPPTVQITAPASGSTFPFKSDITIKGTASDSDGTVQKVEFFAGTTKLGQSTTAPYSFVWHRPGPGTYALTARATDNAGLMTTSSSVSVTTHLSAGSYCFNRSR